MPGLSHAFMNITRDPLSGLVILHDGLDVVQWEAVEVVTVQSKAV